MRTLRGSVVLVLVAAACAGQTTAEWVHSQVDDPLHGTTFQEYRLKGKFLVRPSSGTLDAPELVIHCEPGPHLRGKVHGKFIDAFVSVGAVVDTQVDQHAIAYIPIEIKLDDRKLERETWFPSTDHKGIFVREEFCGDCAISNLLYGHSLPHKENSSPQIQRIMLGVDEYLAREIEMEFDLPDVTEVADACGIIMHK